MITIITHIILYLIIIVNYYQLIILILILIYYHYLYRSTDIYIYIYIHMYTYIYTDIYIYICIYTYIYKYNYIYIYWIELDWEDFFIKFRPRNSLLHLFLLGSCELSDLGTVPVKAPGVPNPSLLWPWIYKFAWRPQFSCHLWMFSCYDCCPRPPYCIWPSIVLEQSILVFQRLV